MAKISEITINPNKIAIYLRWSTDEQTSGTTLEIQLTSCKNYILSQGWNINEELIFIDDGYTGANLERPEMTRLRKCVQEGKVDCIIVYRLDRLSRNLKDAVNLVMGEWIDTSYLKSVTEPIDTTTPLGKQIFYILMGFAEMEREVIKDRVWSGKVTRAKEGKNAGFKPAYGYINELGNPGNFIVVQEELDDYADKFSNWEYYSIEDKKSLLSVWIDKILVYKSKDTDEFSLRIKYIWDKKEEG